MAASVATRRQSTVFAFVDCVCSERFAMAVAKNLPSLGGAAKGMESDMLCTRLHFARARQAKPLDP